MVDINDRKETREPGVVRELAQAYLDDHRLLTMATCGKDMIPNAANLEYANEGFVVYVTSRRDSWKVKNLLENPVVFYEIHDEVNVNDLDQVRSIKGLQVLAKGEVLEFGTAAFDAGWGVMLRKFPVFARLPVDARRVVLKFVPRKLWFLDYSVKFGHRDELEFPDAGDP